MVFDFLVGLAKAVVWMGAYAQLLGMPVAWQRLRRTPAWLQRPDGVRRIDLLAKFIESPTVAAIVWAWAVLAAIALGGLGLSTGALVVVLFGAPAIFVPWAVLRLDVDRFPVQVAEARERRQRKRTGRTQRG